MALNVADLTTLIAFVGCPLAAGISAISNHAGWYTILFITGGIAIGFLIAYVVHVIAYFILIGGAKAQEKHPWLIVPLLTGYMVVPMAIAAGGIDATGNGTVWLIRHFLKM